MNQSSEYEMATAASSTGYGPRRALIFSGDESKYELWEVKFLAHMRLQKLYNVFVPAEEEEPASAAKKADAFAELVQCLDDRSLSLIIREAKDDGPKALEVLRQHYQGKGKPRVISLYTELTTLKKTESESIVDYVIRAETAATALRNADEAVSDALLIAMVLKGLPSSFKTFSAIVVQQDKQMSFAEFKASLRSYEENEKSRNGSNNGENIMVVRNGEKFEGACFKCGKRGHKKSECWSKKNGKWCTRCKSKTHDTRECRSNTEKNDAAKKAENHAQATGTENSEHTFAFKISDSSSECGKSVLNSNLLVDTGATSHIVSDPSKFISFDKAFDARAHIIELADGSKAKVVSGKGVAKVKLYDVNGSPRDLVLNNALYVPSYKQDIFSVNAAVEEGGSISLDKQNKRFKSSDGATFNIEQVGRLYYLNSISSSKNNASTLLGWHRILGHCNFSDIKKLESVVDGMKITSHEEKECKTCTAGKMSQTRNRNPDTRAKAPLELVHTDLAGPITPVGKDGFIYAMSFVDDYSGVIMIYFLKNKTDAIGATQQFLADIAPIGKVKCIRSDNGGEFISSKFKSILRENQIKHQTCAPYSPHQNGTAERAWLSLFSMARCLLIDAKLPKMLWTYAVMTAAYIRNRCFNDRLGKTPYEALTGLRPNLNSMHVFGSVCYAYIQNPKKLDPRSREGIFVGYDKSSPAYLVYYPASMKVEKVRCVKFFDSPELVDAGKVDQIEEDIDTRPNITPEIEQPVTAEEKSVSPQVEGGGHRYPTRTRNRPTYLDEYVAENIPDSTANLAVDYCYRMSEIPSCYAQAINSPDSTSWKRAMDEEIHSLESNDTYELTALPHNREVVGGKWVYTIKSGPNSEQTYKARFVAKGYSQIPGVDYHETFAPTARMSSIRVLIQHAAQNNMVVHQMDVKAAYLNAPIDCDIYVEQPKGYEKVGKNGEKLVCKLNKSLYGLKQSGRNWNETIHDYLSKEGFVQSLADPCVYRKFVDDDASNCIILVIWVDDLIISASNNKLLEDVKKSLSDKFKMKDLGILHWFLGTEFVCSDGMIEMKQSRYIEKILEKFGMDSCKPKATPAIVGLDKFIDMESPALEDPNLYRQIVGSLIYTMTGTRPDLCHIVTRLSQYMSKPTVATLNAAKHVLRYLKKTSSFSLKFKRVDHPLELIGFSDSDWGGSVSDRKSISGYGFQLCKTGPLVSWKSKKQQTVALSTCEAEYTALAETIQEGKFLKQLCVDLGIIEVSKSIVVNADNQGAIKLAKNPAFHKRSKHIDVKYHFIRSEVQQGTVSIRYIASEDNLADIFTKPVSRVRLDKFKPFICN